MEFVGAARVSDVDGRARAAPVFGALVVGHDLKLRDGIRRRLHHLIRKSLVAGAVGVVVETIQQVIAEGAAQSVHVERALASQHRDVAAGADRRNLHAGSQQDERRILAAVQRQFAGGFVSDDLVSLAGLGLDQGRGAGCLHRFRHLSDGELQIDALARTYVDLDIVRYGCREAWHLRADLVSPDSDRRELVVAAAVGCRGRGDVGFEICECDFRALNYSSGRVPNGPQNTARIKLAECGRS